MKTIISKSPSYLSLKSGIYHFRISVPYSLRPIFQKREIKKSLQTGYLKDARSQAGRLAVIMQSLFAIFTQREMNFMADLTLPKVQQLADKWLQEALDDTEDRLVRRKTISREDADLKEETISLELSSLREALYCNDLRSMKPIADELLEEEQLTASKDSTAYLKLLRELRIRQIQSVESELRYLKGETNWKPENVTATTPALKKDITHSVRVSTVVEQYIEEQLRMGEWETKSELNNPPVLRDFIELIGDPYIEEINRELIQKYKRDVARLPKHLKQTILYKDKSLEEILRMDIPENKQFAPKTVSNRYRITKTFLSWAYTNGYDIEERCIDILKNTGKKNKQSEGTLFTIDELQKLFHSRQYREDRFKQSFQFWAPILGLFTGARIEEICQLHLDDFIQEDGVWCFDFNSTFAGP